MVNIEKLKADFAVLNGKPFKHFFCPMLYRDEDVRLCKGHIVNQDFPHAPRATVIQREDVDNFYGHFESEFVKLQYEGTPIEKVVSDDDLRRKLKPRIYSKGQVHEFYPITKNNKGNSHIPLTFSHDKDRQYAIKIAPEDEDKLNSSDLEVRWGANVTADAIPSLIKAAHLSLFYLGGYSYTFANVAEFVGKTILGRFFLENRHQSREAIRKAGEIYFADYKEMVRPVEKISGAWSFNGTVSDRKLLLCKSLEGIIWGTIVFINLGTKLKPLQAVLMPMEDMNKRAASAILFCRFLQGEIRQFEGRLHSYQPFGLKPEEACWRTMYWPAS